MRVFYFNVNSGLTVYVSLKAFSTITSYSNAMNILGDNLPLI
jgi:hypothetical protein